MKSSLIFVIAILFFFGCNEKKQMVEVVPDLDQIYLPSVDVDTPPKESEEMNKKMDKDLLAAVKSLYVKNSNKPMMFRIALRIYLNEKGTIDKIKDISNNFYKIENNADSVAIYSDMQKLDDAIANSMSDWKFDPAKNNGQNVKCRNDIRLNILLRPNGEYSMELPDLAELGNTLKNIFSPEERFYIQVEQMPTIIGGMKALVDNIKYPKTAKDEGIEGKVYIRAYIDEQGNVVKTKILKGADSRLDNAAIDAVNKIKFTPGKQKGKPVKVQIVIPIVFKLH